MQTLAHFAAYGGFEPRAKDAADRTTVRFGIIDRHSNLRQAHELDLCDRRRPAVTRDSAAKLEDAKDDLWYQDDPKKRSGSI